MEEKLYQSHLPFQSNANSLILSIQMCINNLWSVKTIQKCSKWREKKVHQVIVIVDSLHVYIATSRIWRWIENGMKCVVCSLVLALLMLLLGGWCINFWSIPFRITRSFCFNIFIEGNHQFSLSLCVSVSHPLAISNDSSYFPLFYEMFSHLFIPFAAAATTAVWMFLFFLSFLFFCTPILIIIIIRFLLNWVFGWLLLLVLLLLFIVLYIWTFASICSRIEHAFCRLEDLCPSFR